MPLFPSMLSRHFPSVQLQTLYSWLCRVLFELIHWFMFRSSSHLTNSYIRYFSAMQYPTNTTCFGKAVWNFVARTRSPQAPDQISEGSGSLPQYISFMSWQEKGKDHQEALFHYSNHTRTANRLSLAVRRDNLRMIGGTMAYRVVEKSKPLQIYRQNLLNPASKAIFFIKFECKRCTTILYVGTKCSMHDLIFDVITQYAWSCDTCYINSQLKTRRRDKWGIRYLHEFLCKLWSRSELGGLLRSTDARVSQSHTWPILQLCGSRRVRDGGDVTN